MTQQQLKDCVINRTKQILENMGIKTICLDRLPKFIEEKRVNNIVSELIDDTIYWETTIY